MSTYCIGDVHGCYRKLNQLLELIGIGNEDQVWFTGDVINRGEDSVGVLRLIKKNANFHSVIGNHELYWLASHYFPHKFPKLFLNELVFSSTELEEVLDWVGSWSFFHEMSGYLLVHAGFFPFWSYDEGINYFKQFTDKFREEGAKEFIPTLFDSPSLFSWLKCSSKVEQFCFINEALLRMRFCSAKQELNLILTEKPSKKISPLWRPWFNFLPLDFPKIVLFGHWASLNGITHHKKAIALDTGCVWGGKLTAFCLETQQFFSV